MDKVDIYSVIQVKKDLKTLYELINFIFENKNGYREVFIINMMSYISLAVCEGIDLLKKLVPDFEVVLDTNFSIKDVRLRTKLFYEKKFNKIIELVEKIDCMSEFEFRDCRYNLSIQTDSNNHIINNTQLLLYFFQPQTLKKVKLGDVKSLCEANVIGFSKLSKHALISYTTSIGKAIVNLNSMITEMLNKEKNTNKECPEFIDNVDLEFNNNYKVIYRNANINDHNRIFKDITLSKPIKIYLLDLLSMTNFFVYTYNKIVQKDFGYNLRIKFICCYYVVGGLDKLRKHIKNNNQMGKKIIQIFERLQLDDMSLFSPDFRNCMMHYSFRDNDGYSLINDIEYDIDKLFFGLIESCYNGMSYDDFKIKIDKKLKDISEILEEWLDIQMDDMEIEVMQ